MLDVSAVAVEKTAKTAKNAKKPQSVKSQKSPINMQDYFLTKMVSKQMAVTLYLLTGIRIQGYILAYDHRVVAFQTSINQMIYRSAIASIVPSELILCPKVEN